MSGLELKWLAASLLGGAGCGLAGFILLSMNLPFMGVCLAHAALAGAVFGFATGLPYEVCAFAAALLAAAVLGPVADRTLTEVNAVLSIFFSLTLGLAFLGIGLMRHTRTEVMGLMWGNLLLVRNRDLAWLALALAFPVAYLARFDRQVRAVLFDRGIAATVGVPAAAVYYALITLCGMTVTVNLNVVGGLMLYSLLINPAAAAAQLRLSYRASLVASAVAGAIAAAGGLLLSLGLNWPVGASIVLVSSAMFASAAGIRCAAGRRVVLEGMSA